MKPLPWIVMVALFVASVVYIRTAVPGGDTVPRPVDSHAAHHSDGLSDSHNGYLLSPVELPTTRGAAVPLAFEILGPDQKPISGYATVQEKPLHLYVVREDLSFYQHLHPELVGGTWSTTVSVPDGGVYRVYAEFTHAGAPHVLGLPFIIAGDTRYAPVAAPAASASVEGFTVHRVDGTAKLAAGQLGSLRFQVRDASGAPVAALEQYLGTYAHVSAFDVYAQGLTHLHPAAPATAEGILTFHALFRQRGEQRLFLQFQVAGAVHQAAFTVSVT